MDDWTMNEMPDEVQPEGGAVSGYARREAMLRQKYRRHR